MLQIRWIAKPHGLQRTPGTHSAHHRHHADERLEQVKLSSDAEVRQWWPGEELTGRGMRTISGMVGVHPPKLTECYN